jgi:hypothetical protein
MRDATSARPLGDITGAPNTRGAHRGKGKHAKGGKPQQQRKRKNKKARSRRTPQYDVSSSGGESSAAEENIDYAAAARLPRNRATQRALKMTAAGTAGAAGTADQGSTSHLGFHGAARQHKPALPRTTLSAGETARQAVCKGDVATLTKLLTADPELVHDCSEIGELGSIEAGLTVLHVACQLGSAECTELILNFEPNVNAQTEGGSTALHNACSQGHATCVELLLSAGAKINLRDIMDQTAKQVAEYSARGNWVACFQLIQQEEERFGWKVLKVGGGVTFAVVGLGAFAWWWRNRKE